MAFIIYFGRLPCFVATTHQHLMAATHFDSIYLLVFLFVCKLTFPRGWQLKFANFSFFLFALTYLLIRLSFSLFLDFWTFLFSYFLPHPPSISTPFSHLLPALENGVTSNIDILLAPLSYRPQISICYPFPPFIFIPITVFLFFLLVRKFSYCFLFPLFLTFFLSFLPYSFSH